MNRRALLLAAAGLPFAAYAQKACTNLTPEDMEGPFYKAGAPSKANLVEANSKAPKLVIAGRVINARCEPLANAKLDFWHADDQGEYDHAGYRYRGIVVTDAQGRYRLETNQPPPYMGRPRHVHVKVFAANAKPLTTQLYFPGESRGADRDLVLKLARASSGLLDASYDFVVI